MVSDNHTRLSATKGHMKTLYARHPNKVEGALLALWLAVALFGTNPNFKADFVKFMQEEAGAAACGTPQKRLCVTGDLKQTPSFSWFQ